jgi:hypothetical protein
MVEVSTGNQPSTASIMFGVTDVTPGVEVVVR